jgi:thioredoxin reductase (NADPH)
LHATPPSVIETEALVIGAGPTGLFLVFQLGLLGIHAQVIDALPQAGGQVIELYPDKPIYDIPAVPVCTGRELVERLLLQIQPFQPELHFNQEVGTLAPQADGRVQVGTAQGEQFLAQAVFIAAGVGAFQPRLLKVPGIEALEGRQVFHRRQPPSRFTGQRLVIVGGDELALEQAIACAQAQGMSHPVTLLHRRRVFQAPAELVAQFDALCEADTLRFVAGQVSALDLQGEHLQSLQILTPEGQQATLALDTLQVMLGLSPKLGPITDWGLALERKQVRVDPATCATSVPEVYAVGDINHYTGKKRLIVCGFHEATMAAHAAAARLHPEQSGVLQYTSASTLLQKRLGLPL